MKVKGTLTIELVYDETDLKEVKEELTDVMNDIVKRDMFGAGPTTAFNGPYLLSQFYKIDTEVF